MTNIPVITPLMDSIATMEGFHKSATLSQVNKNPGNLRAGKRATGHDQRGYAIYATVDDGWQDLADLLAWYASKHYTLLGMMERYAPSADSNDPNAYAKFIAKRINCALDTPVSTLLGGSSA